MCMQAGRNSLKIYSFILPGGVQMFGVYLNRYLYVRAVIKRQHTRRDSLSCTLPDPSILRCARQTSAGDEHNKPHANIQQTAPATIVKNICCCICRERSLFGATPQHAKAPARVFAHSNPTRIPKRTHQTHAYLHTWWYFGCVWLKRRKSFHFLLRRWLCVGMCRVARTRGLFKCQCVVYTRARVCHHQHQQEDATHALM